MDTAGAGSKKIEGYPFCAGTESSYKKSAG